ncbi:acetate/propionate family kinase [Thermicanus aegyptius]|uniref:acetate/propionate family kinase n=1 Tax=Thermicanus aegyptius TaxID=94009 RepID=UPI00040E3388|nr:acetate kinase [Thermicanus aegyptius]
MKVLVINSGSSSLKYQLFDMEKEMVLAKGLVERIGMETAIFSHQPYFGEKVTKVGQILEHKEAIRKVLAYLTDEKVGVISNVEEISAVGHRVVHGGEAFSDAAYLDPEVIRIIEKNIELAPLHNPAHLKGIYAFRELLGGDFPMVAVFDTAFHQTMPEESFMYALPMVLYKRHKIRRYGFHGTSHKFVSQRLSEILGESLEGKKVVSCHIGNGASITAIKDGKSYDTSMGMTPLEGLVMGTRSGDIDPAVVPFVMAKEDLTIGEVNSMLNKHSGLLGISGLSSDMREITAAMFEGHPGATLAFNLYIQRIKKYIGAYAAEMNGIDAIIFTGGVGENSELVRKRVLDGLTFLGVELDDALNEASSPKERRITTERSKVAAYVIPTNEELMIARETLRVVTERRKGERKSDEHASQVSR